MAISKQNPRDQSLKQVLFSEYIINVCFFSKNYQYLIQNNYQYMLYVTKYTLREESYKIQHWDNNKVGMFVQVNQWNIYQFFFFFTDSSHLYFIEQRFLHVFLFHSWPHFSWRDFWRPHVLINYTENASVATATALHGRFITAVLVWRITLNIVRLCVK